MAASYTGTDKTRSGSATSTMERAMGSASETAGKVAGAIEEGADAVKERSREAAEGAMKMADDMGSVVRKSLKDQPMTRLAIAAGIGFVLGAIWKN